jgi:hypothetical protein
LRGTHIGSDILQFRNQRLAKRLIRRCARRTALAKKNIASEPLCHPHPEFRQSALLNRFNWSKQPEFHRSGPNLFHVSLPSIRQWQKTLRPAQNVPLRPLCRGEIS